MSTVVQPFIDNLHKFKTDIPKIVEGVIIEHKEEILSIVQDIQLGKGLDSFNKKLVHPSKRNGTSKRIGEYEHITSNYFAKLYPPNKPKEYGGAYNFNWTGSLFDGMDIKDFKKYEYTIYSKDFKADILKNQYKTELFDLTDEHNDWVNENIILPQLYKKMIEYMFMGLL